MYSIKHLLVTVFLVGLGLPTMADIIWPADGAWNPVYKGSDYYYDAAGDVTGGGNPQLDLIGTTNTYSAGYWAVVNGGYTGTGSDAFIMRMRLGGDGSSSPNAWIALLDTDGDTSDVEWALEVVQSGGTDNVRLVQAIVGGPTIGEVTLTNSPVWSGNIPEFSRWTAIPSTTPTQYHLDFAVPMDAFLASTGLADLHDTRVVLGTSTTHTGFNNGDFPLGALFSEQVSNVLSENVPEPAVVTLIIGAGFGMLVSRRLFCHNP